MKDHPTSERLSDLLEGLLEGTDLEATELHLQGCPACAERLVGLSRLLDELGGLPAEAWPERDLWPEIAERIGGVEARGEPRDEPAAGADGTAKVLAFPSPGHVPGGGAGRSARRFSVTLPQLAAAAVLVALLSAGSVWWALSGGALGGAGGVPLADAPATGAPAEAVPAGYAASAAGPAAAPLEAALADLETALVEGRDLLDPTTLAVVEESLLTIDRAIAEAKEALAADPNSELLNRLLINNQRAKLRVLQQATAGLILS